MKGFIDLFAGCGGLSLGLMQAGWKGLFAIEKSPMAFETLSYNLVNREDNLSYDWPDWLSTEAIEINTFLEKHQDKLTILHNLPLLAGGPPCQGYSHAGRRDPNDERNLLIDRYLDLVAVIQPAILLIENVSGFATDFNRERGNDRNYNADRELRLELENQGYRPFVRPFLMAKDFGVPQLRPRYILIAIKCSMLERVPGLDPFQILYESRHDFLKKHGLPADREVTLKEAISDLLKSHGHIQCIESGMARFRQGLYGPIQGDYQELMRLNRNKTPFAEGIVVDSHRFPNHKEKTVERFKKIITDFRPGIQLSADELKSLGLNKHRIAPLSADEACHTLTSLPDDLVHYLEPRIPTVREYARIQSFPDWFEFKSKYTTGGNRRKVEIPRYTQVANAVPPLLAKALGETLLQVYQLIQAKDEVNEPPAFHRPADDTGAGTGLPQPLDYP